MRSRSAPGQFGRGYGATCGGGAEAEPRACVRESGASDWASVLLHANEGACPACGTMGRNTGSRSGTGVAGRGSAGEGARWEHDGGLVRVPAGGCVGVSVCSRAVRVGGGGRGGGGVLRLYFQGSFL